MSRKDRYYIDVYNLKNGIHQYSFDIDDLFFSFYENTFTDKGKGSVSVTVDKAENLITVTFDVDVQVELICDRSLEKFDYPIKKQEKLLFKYGDEEQELDVDVLMITKDTQRINLGQHIFEYIGLSIPYKKLHPRFEEIEEEQDELIFRTDSEEEDENAEDPRWAALKKLKGDN